MNLKLLILKVFTSALILLSSKVFSQNPVCENIIEISANEIVNFNPESGPGDAAYPNDMMGACTELGGIGGKEQIYRFVAPTNGVYNFQTQSTLPSLAIEYLYMIGEENICSTTNWTCIGESNQLRTLDGFELYEGQILLILANSRSGLTAYSQSFRLIGPHPLACENLEVIQVGQEYNFQSDTLQGSPRFPNQLNTCFEYNHQGGQEKMFLFSPTFTGRYRLQVNSSLNANRVNYMYKTNMQTICANGGWNCLNNVGSSDPTSAIYLEANTPVVFLLNAERYLTPTSVNFEIIYQPDVIIPVPLTEIFLNQEVVSIATIELPIFNASVLPNCAYNYNNGGSYDNFVFEAPESGYYKVDIYGGTPVDYEFLYADYVPDYAHDAEYSCWMNSTQWNTESEYCSWKYIQEGQKVLIGLRSADLSHNIQFKIVKSLLNCESPIQLECNQPTAVQIEAGYISDPILENACFFPNLNGEKFAKFTASQTGYFNVHMMEVDVATTLLHFVTEEEISPCEITNWNCYYGVSQGDVSAFQIFMTAGQTLHLVLQNFSYNDNNIVIKIECDIAPFCEDIIPITTHMENVFHNESSIALTGDYLDVGTCGGSQLSTFSGRPQIYLYSPITAGNTEIQVTNVLNNRMFAYYYKVAQNDPCSLSNWVCLGQRNSPGIVGDFNAYIGTSYYILVVPLAYNQPSEQSFFLNRNIANYNTSVDISPIICHDSQDGFIHLNLPTSSNIANISVVWSDLEYNGENITQRNNLSGGDYTVNVTINFFVSYEPLHVQAIYHIEELPPLSAFVNISPPDNSTFDNGFIELIPYNARGVSDVIWTSTGNLSNTIGNIPAGIYCAQILDEFGCTADTCIELVSAPNEALSYTFSKNDITCYGDSTGSLEISVQGGIPPYLIEWPLENIITSQFNRSNLGAGYYPFIIYDAQDHQLSGSIYLVQNTPITPIITASPIVYDNLTGGLSIEVIGGVPVYTIEWSHLDGDDQPFFIQSDLPIKYCFEITDSIGCQVQSCTEIPQVVLAPLQWNGTTNISPCINNRDATAGATGGVFPYKYDWLHIPGTLNSPTISIPNEAGSYTVIITDATNNSITKTIEFMSESNITVITSLSPTIGNGSSLGQLSLEVTTNNPPFNIVWHNYPEFNNLLNLTNLSAGQYPYTITDAAGCSTSGFPFITTELKGIILDVEIDQPYCQNSQDGGVDIELVSGVPPISYDWLHLESFIEPQDLNNINAGTYVLNATDANGLTGNYVIIVEALSTLNVELTPTAAASEGSLDGSIEAVVTGGVPPYQIIWSHLDYLGPTEMFEVDQLNPGLYHALVFDGEGCVVSASATIDNISSVDQINDSESGISIYPNPSNGTFVIDKKMDFEIEQLEIYNHLGQMVKSLSPNFSRQEVSLASGNYYIKMTNSKSIFIQKIQVY